MTRVEAETLIRELADDPDGARWSDFNLRLLASVTLDDLWSDLLTSVPGFLSQLDTVTSLDSPGYLDTRLVADGGKLSQRFFRIQSLTRDDQEYSQVQGHQVVLEDSERLVGPDHSWIRYGDALYLLPLELTPEVEIRYSYLPTKWSDLGGNTEVPWPDGHEFVYVQEIAGRAMLKGSAEDPTRILQLADSARRRCIAHCQKVGPGPLMMRFLEDPVAWGGT